MMLIRPFTQTHSPHATSYMMRRQALNNDMTRYSCCQGYICCAPDCVGESRCPELCLAVETLLCFPNSVLATRYYLQDQMVLQNTQCDNNLIACEMALVQLSCICDCAAIISSEWSKLHRSRQPLSISSPSAVPGRPVGDLLTHTAMFGSPRTDNPDVKELAGLVHCIADHVYCSMCACMQTQHKVWPLAVLLSDSRAFAESRLDGADNPIVVPFPLADSTGCARPRGAYSAGDADDGAGGADDGNGGDGPHRRAAAGARFPHSTTRLFRRLPSGWWIESVCELTFRPCPSPRHDCAN